MRTCMPTHTRKHKDLNDSDKAQIVMVKGMCQNISKIAGIVGCSIQ